MNISDYHYLIIGGTPKAGTTSLYKWLSDHPDICASSLKETRFFLDADYPLPCPEQYNGTNLEQYADFFKPCQGNDRLIRLDATPDYLYTKTALKIADLLPHSKIVFILRDPVERMVSWYKYAKQEGILNKDISFEDYVRIQVGKPINPETPTYLRALDQCRFEKYLPAFQEVFGERCLIINFNDLKDDPRKAMARLCAFANLKDEFYDTYHFKPENVSQTTDNASIMRFYTSLRRKLIYALHKYPMIFDLMKKPNQLIKKILFRNAKQAEGIQASSDITEIIKREIEQDIHQKNGC